MPITKASSNAVAPAAKGDLVVGNATNDSGVLGVGANGTVLTAASGQATGLQWATPVSGSMTLLTTTTLSGTSTTITGINQTYKNLYVEIFGITSTTSNGTYNIEFAGAVGLSNYGGNSAWSTNNNPIQLGQGAEPLRTNANNFWQLSIFNYASTTTRKGFTGSGSYVDTASTNRGYFFAGGCASNDAVDYFTFTQGSGHSFSTGTVRIYGVN
jgi:hypothetical protein